MPGARDRQLLLDIQASTSPTAMHHQYGANLPPDQSALLTCRLQQLMLSNTLVKLTAVFLFATPAVLIGGQLYSILTGTSPLEGFLKIYSVLYLIPGEQLPWLPRSTSPCQCAAR